MINVGIIGATGYAGVELLRLLLHHPQATVSALSSVSFEGKKISEVYPNPVSYTHLSCKKPLLLACVHSRKSAEMKLFPRLN